MADDMVSVPADTLHAFLAVFARIDHLAKSPAVGELRDAMAVEGRARAQLTALQPHIPAIVDALAARIADERWESQKVRFRDAKAVMVVLGGGAQERSDEKEPKP